MGSIIELHSDKIPEHDLLTYSFPCQDLSTGGKTLGMSKGSGTRSGLLWEIERILNELNTENRLPKYLLMENVKAILALSNKKDFDIWKSFLKSLGYDNEVMTLSGIDFGVPQDRERCFMVSVLNGKADIEKNGKLGEQIIADYLKKELLDRGDFYHVSKEHALSPYDMEYTLNDIKYYVEVKATQSDKINFYLSPGEMKFMEENKETYILYMVTNVRDSKPNIKKFIYKDILKLKSKPTSARFSI